MKGPAIAMTSNSCPANLTIKRELSGAKVKVLLVLITWEFSKFCQSIKMLQELYKTVISESEALASNLPL